MGCYQDWNSPMRVGSHHLAGEFVRAGWDVAYVSNAISPVQIIRDAREFRRRAGSYQWGGSLDLGGHLWSFIPFALLTPHNAPVLSSRLIHRNWHRTTVPSLRHQVSDRGFGSVDLLYLESAWQRFWLDVIERQKSVVRVMDRMTGFPGYPEQMSQMEREMIRAVDLVVYSARDLESDILQAGAKDSMHLPNGVAYAHFAAGTTEVPAEYREIRAPIVVYAGAMNARFDYRTVNAAIDALPDVSFVFIGPGDSVHERLAARHNVHVLGWRSYARLPAYLRHADIGIIPFDAEARADLVNGVHPLKLAEYLASGLAVVARRWPELERISSPALLYDDPEGCIDAIRASIAHPPDPELCREFARQADWGNRVDALLSRLAGSPTT